ncbi:hypothetical protein B296_00005181 [Ensete ventricosum]|uniref:Reverse transcriptase domain-containing protein n=1 Tax=Ensete ventricosum TaxID=4639 RepID=A0A427ATK3_ENSVE|nr:hypothetical protein B296_00005181 [Ensete ventricosum]
MAENPNASVIQPTSRSRNVVCIPSEPDAVSSDSTDSMREQLRQVNQRLDEVQREFVKSKEEVGETSKGGSPFVPEIQDKPVPPRFRLWILEPYDGRIDPSEHIATFRAKMAGSLRHLRRFDVSRLSDDPQGVGSDVVQLTEAIFHLILRPPRQRIRTQLHGELPPKVDNRLTTQPCPPSTVLEMLQRANQYVAVETLVAGKWEDHKRLRNDKPQGQPSGTSRRRDRPELPAPRPLSIPLNSTRMEVFLQIRDKGLLRTPNPIRTKIGGRDKKRYCRFHRDYGHDTEECNDLKNQIEDLIRRGHFIGLSETDKHLPTRVLVEKENPHP